MSKTLGFEIESGAVRVVATQANKGSNASTSPFYYRTADHSADVARGSGGSRGAEEKFVIAKGNRVERQSNL